MAKWDKLKSIYRLDLEDLLNPQEKYLDKKCVFKGSLEIDEDLLINGYKRLIIDIKGGRVGGDIRIKDSVIRSFNVEDLEVCGDILFSFIDQNEKDKIDHYDARIRFEDKEVRYSNYLGKFAAKNLSVQKGLSLLDTLTSQIACTDCSFGSFTLMDGSLLQQELSFSKTSKKDSRSSINMLFLEGLTSSEFNGKIKIENTEIGTLALDDSEFLDKFRLRQCVVKEANFISNTTFGDLADFYGTTFEGPVNFFKCDFKGVAVFSDAKFHNNLLFTFSEFRNHLIFRGTKFTQNNDVVDSPAKPGLDLSTAILPEKVFFQYVELGYFICSDKDVNDAERYYYFEKVFKNEKSNDAKERAYGITYKNRRDTYRIIKKYASDNEDFYEASDFGYFEAKSKQEMLGWEIDQKKENLGSMGKSLILLKQDKLIHDLNNLSNRHKTSWVKSIGFILIGASVSFVLILMAGMVKDETLSIHDYVKLFFGILNPLHKLDLYSSFPKNIFYPNGFVFFLDFFARLYISYGYYQFIQAFRRFK